jgi:hypothetical protein
MTDEFTQAVTELDDPIARMLDEAADEIESLEAEIKHLKAGLHDCRLCYHYMHSAYMPSCESPMKCKKGHLWTRTKVIQMWA